MVFKSNTAKLKNFVKTFWSVFRSRAKNINLSCNCQCQCPELIFAVFQSLLINLQFVFYCIQRPKLVISSSFPGSSSRDPIVLLAGATRLAICCWRHLQTAVQSDTFATHLLQTALQSDLSNPPDMSRLGSNLNTCNTAALLTLDSAELYVSLNVIKRCQ